ncbi:MAG TPA: hypothetical protein PKV38_04090 [bacterium]|nr:hypothetical protein [bacterium]
MQPINPETLYQKMDSIIHLAQKARRNITGIYPDETLPEDTFDLLCQIINVCLDTKSQIAEISSRCNADTLISK